MIQKVSQTLLGIQCGSTSTGMACKKSMNGALKVCYLQVTDHNTALTFLRNFFFFSFSFHIRRHVQILICGNDVGAIVTLHTPGKTAENQRLDQVVTDVDGKYLFESLPDGNYVVAYYLTRDLLSSTFQFTASTVGSDDALDSDATPSASNIERIRGEKIN